MTVFSKLASEYMIYSYPFIRFSGCNESKYNSVSSKVYKYDSYHFIEPINVPNINIDPFEPLLHIIIDMDGEIITSERYYIHATFSTCFKFIDDVEFEFIPSKNIIDVKSCSRTGYWDFGKNRKRIEKIRKLMEK